MFPNIWDSIPYEWIININEPWWRTTGVMALLLFVLFVLLLIYLYLYIKNANMRARRNSEEQGVIKRIKGFVERCDARNGLVLQPLPEEIGGVDAGLATSIEADPAFVNVMTVLMPVVLANDVKKLSMRELSGLVHMKLPEFYTLITSNIFKNPRPVALQIMLERAKEMLKADKTKDIMEISAECGFASPNYFISSFYHKYHQTPAEYRVN
jgi:AraC-like DNA-binding protein